MDPDHPVQIADREIGAVIEKDRRVRAGPAIDGVVTAHAIDGIVAGSSNELLARARSNNHLICCHSAGGRNRDRRVGELERLDIGQEDLVESVKTRGPWVIHPCHTAERGDREVAAVLEKDRRVGAGTAVDGVVAAPPIQRVVGGGTIQCVVRVLPMTRMLLVGAIATVVSANWSDSTLVSKTSSKA